MKSKLKRVFILVAVWYWILLAAIGIYFVNVLGFGIATAGMLLSALLPLAFYLGLNVATVARAAIRQIAFTIIILAGTLMPLASLHEVGWPVVAMYAGGFMFWVLYLFWYAVLELPDSPYLQTGKVLPELTFETPEGNTFYCSQLLGKKVVYLFYRGNWCPVDMAQIRELSRQYSDLQERGAEVLLISPQPPEKTSELAAKLSAAFVFLTDCENRMARLLGIEHPEGVPLGFGMSQYRKDTVLPTVVITDEQGRIIYVDRTNNYLIRPEPEELIEAVARA